jgi:hypothetical protein
MNKLKKYIIEYTIDDDSDTSVMEFFAENETHATEQFDDAVKEERAEGSTLKVVLTTEMVEYRVTVREVVHTDYQVFLTADENIDDHAAELICEEVADKLDEEWVTWEISETINVTEQQSKV